MEDEELNEILKILTVTEYKLQKAVYKKEQTEGKSECSKEKIEIIKHKVNNMLLILEEIRQ